MPSGAANVKNAEVSSLVRRVYRVLERAVVAAVAIIGVLLAVVALRLMAGPVDLEFLKSRIAQEFETPAGKMSVKADRIYAEWSAMSQPIRLVAVGLHVTDAQMDEVATAPSVALTFEPRSVLRGVLLPRSIVVQRPTLQADIDRQGGMLRRILAERDASSQGELVDLLIEQLLAEPNHHSLLGQLDVVQVEGATVTVRDVPSGMTWVAPAARASLRRDASGVIIEADAQFSSGGEPVDVALSGTYSRDRSRISAVAKIDGLKPSMLADLSPDAAILRGIDIALSGRLEIDADGAGRIRTVAVDVTGGAGKLNLPGILPVAHNVHSVSAHASIDASTHTAKITNINVDLGVAKVTVVGEGTRTEQGQTFSGRADIRNIPLGHLADFWPLEFAAGGRNWALANLSDGTLDVAAEFALSAPGNEISQLTVTRSVAFLDYRDMTVHYMPHMPELKGVSGRGRFENGTLHFDVDRGAAVGLRVSGASIDLTGLSGPPPQEATIRMPIHGPASAVMALLSRPRLGLSKDALYDPRRIGGEAAIDLTLTFPLLNTLTVGDIDIKSDASLTGFSLRNAVGAVDLTEATGQVTYANSEFHVTGHGKLDGHAVEIGWTELFGDKPSYRQRYELKGTLPTLLAAKAGFLSPEPYIAGPVGVAVRYQVQTNGTGEVTAKLDLKGATASVAPLGWAKEAGKEAVLDLTMKLASGGRITLAEFNGHGGGLAAKGQVRFAANNSVEHVTLKQMSIGRSDISFDWKRGAAGVELSLSGRALEWARVRQALRARDDLAKSTPGGAAERAHERTRLSIRLDQLLFKRGTLGSVTGNVDLAGDRIASADVAVSGGNGTAFRVSSVTSGGGSGRKIGLYVPDFGLLLSKAGWLDGFKGSFLEFSGHFDDSKADSPLDGVLRLGPYKVEKVAPRPDIGTLNATIDGLNRAGDPSQQFTGLDATVTKSGDRIDIRNAHTSGSSIGLTTAGWLDVESETVHLRGIVVPAFALNNLLSNVPLLGPLLTGGKDGGVFAITYRLDGPFDDPKLHIDMMSAVTPGALRQLFTAPADGSSPPSAVGDPPAQQKAP